jgi:hypothetical protein
MCNIKMPRNAINVTDVRVGHVVSQPFGLVENATVLGISTGSTYTWIDTDQGSLRCLPHGTLRLSTVSDAYNYHNGHGCSEDN